jgi:hypothetical protein
MPLNRARFLEGPRDAARGDAVRLQRRDVLAEQAHLAGIGRVEAGDHVDHRGLARAVRADQAENLALTDVERNTLQRTQAAEAAFDPGAGECDGSVHDARRAAILSVIHPKRPPSGRCSRRSLPQHLRVSGARAALPDERRLLPRCPPRLRWIVVCLGVSSMQLMNTIHLVLSTLPGLVSAPSAAAIFRTKRRCTALSRTRASNQ